MSEHLRWGRSPVGLLRTDWVSACRPRHQVKNALGLLPAIVSHQTDPDIWFAALSVAIAFSICAAGVYLINDVRDRHTDRASRLKASRPIAAGRITPVGALAISGLLVPLGVALAWTAANADAALWIACYVLGAIAYTIWLKRWMMLDVAWLVGLYELRIVAGAAAITLADISAWLFALPLFALFAPALAKRVDEIRTTQAQGGGLVPGRGWRTHHASLALGLGHAFVVATVLTAVLYTVSDTARAAYARPELLWIAAPAIACGLERILWRANRGELGEDPVTFATGDPLCWVFATVLAVVFLAAL